MIVKKLSVARGGAFPAAGYNERKVAEGVARLMLMENVTECLRSTVDTLHRFGLDAGAEIERYLKERSKTYETQQPIVFSSMCRRQLKVEP